MAAASASVAALLSCEYAAPGKGGINMHGTTLARETLKDVIQGATVFLRSQKRWVEDEHSRPVLPQIWRRLAAHEVLVAP